MKQNSKELKGEGVGSLNLNAHRSLFNLNSQSLELLCPSLPLSIHPAHPPPGLRSLLPSGNTQSTRSSNHPVSYTLRKVWVTALSEDLPSRGGGGVGKN